MRQVQKHAFLLVGIFAVWFTAQAAIKPSQGTGRVIEDFKEIPLEAPGWYGIVQEFDDVTVKTLKNCALMTRDYENEQGYDCNLSIVYGVDLGDFHQPEVCMQGQGWKPLNDKLVTIRSKTPYKAKMVSMSNTSGQIIMLYWFATEGTTTTVLGGHKIKRIINRIKGGQLKPSAMIRMIAPVDGDEAAVEKATLDLAAVMAPYINETLSKKPVFENSGGSALGE